MIVNGVNLPDPDVGDYNFAAKYERAQDTIVREMETLKGAQLRNSEQIKVQCEVIFEFCDEVFGEGTAKRVFGDSVNLRICINAYAEIVEGVNKLSATLAADFRSRSQTVAVNRQQWRHNNHHKKHK